MNDPKKTTTMAKMNVPFPFSGKWAGLSVYELKGVGTVARSHSGPKGHDVKTKPSFDLTRRNYSEHGACSTASKYLRRTLHPLEAARDYPMSGPVTGWLKDFLPQDTESEFGKRHILLSKAPRLLEGINLSRKYPFDSVIRGGISYELDRDTLRAAVQLPALKVGVSFTPAGNQPYFKVVAALGVAPDLLFGEEGYSFARDYEGFRPITSETGWIPTAEGAEAVSLHLQLPYAPPDDSFALVLTLGVLMGTIGHRGQVEAVKYAGCAKVMAAG
jgi:hypothetical protein